MKRRVLLADDHALVRRGIKSLIDGYSAFEVVAEASDGREAVSLTKVLRPDIVVMDITMPGLNGLDATEQILRFHPPCAVVVLSMHSAERYVIEAFRRGALAYVIKDAAPEALELALGVVAGGGRYLSPPLPRSLLDRARLDRSDEPALTGRQREILQLVAEGNSTREIAECLHISVKTVETHRSQLMQRLGIFDVAGLTRHAIRCGLVTSER